MIEVSPVSGFVPYSEYGSGSRGAVEADVMKFFLNATNNKMTGVDSFLSEDKGCGFADGLCEDTEYGRYNDLIIVDTDRRADISSIDFIKHHRYGVKCIVFCVHFGNRGIH